MDFRFTKDQQDLIDAAREVFIGENTLERLRAMLAGNEVASLWPQFYELGLVGLMVEEGQNGLGQSLSVMAAVAEAAGYVGLPEPFVELAGISLPVLMQQKQTEVLEAVLNNQDRLAVLSPMRPLVNCVDDFSLFATGEGADFSIHKADDIGFVKHRSIDPLRNISRASCSVSDNQLANWHGGVLSAAQLVGLSHRMVDMAVAYSIDRKQFGQPIGSFQAVKHLLANVHTQIEFTRPTIWLAAAKGGANVHAAKIAAIDTATQAAEAAIQVFGGMGYTFEVDLHLFMKRAWALSNEWGDRNFHARALSEHVFASDREIGPGVSFAS
ncbi:acyl-CoA dehydrogenase family protein [Alphaproteobacteria bacterium]|jgi:alkylation response protein AidB-like acyl-CoA dehydrogenase|nr:acyl-CoA dehydrogenase family protein [Alphaproteobacteria bacterium]